jgi:digeranylgeranylglycerophospholipid reductase
MNEYDVVVVGAGPAGSSAAKVAAGQELKTILLEEHTAIGVPEHCSGVLFATIRPALTQEILATMDKCVILREYSALRVFAPSGRVVKEASFAGTNSYLIQRDYFDRALARQAVNAGAELRLNTRVTGLLKRDGRVIGVTTSSTTMPDVYGKVVIGTDGIYAAQRGIPKWAGLIKDEQTFIGGISFELARVRDIEPEVFEFHAGAFTRKGWTSIFPRDDSACMTHFLTMAEFERAKAGNYVFSRKIKEAIPIRMTGWNHTSDLGVGLPKAVEDGLILAGSAANLMGILPSVVSGRYAGEVAVEAVQDDDVTVKKLSRYEDLIKTLKSAKGFLEGFPFYERSDEAIEKLLVEMIERDEFPRSKPMPI